MAESAVVATMKLSRCIRVPGMSGAGILKPKQFSESAKEPDHCTIQSPAHSLAPLAGSKVGVGTPLPGLREAGATAAGLYPSRGSRVQRREFRLLLASGAR
jgi:hypothetical protein